MIDLTKNYADNLLQQILSISNSMMSSKGLHCNEIIILISRANYLLLSEASSDKVYRLTQFSKIGGVDISQDWHDNSKIVVREKSFQNEFKPIFREITAFDLWK